MSQCDHDMLKIGLGQLEQQFVNVCRLGNDLYRAPSSQGSSIGAHMRHILEFMQMLSRSVRSGQVNYEARTRNSIYEFDAAQTDAVFRQTVRDLESAIQINGTDMPLTLIGMPGTALASVETPTSLGREIFYVIEHTIHHFAIIKMIAAEKQIQLGENFGVAPATQAYQAGLSEIPSPDRAVG